MSKATIVFLLILSLLGFTLDVIARGKHVDCDTLHTQINIETNIQAHAQKILTQLNQKKALLTVQKNKTCTAQTSATCQQTEQALVQIESRIQMANKQISDSNTQLAMLHNAAKDCPLRNAKPATISEIEAD